MKRTMEKTVNPANLFDAVIMLDKLQKKPPITETEIREKASRIFPPDFVRQTSANIHKALDELKQTF